MEHPISELMQTAMSSMKDMVDVNTVVGHPVQASSGSTIIPISRVTFGYMTAGGDLLADKPAKDAPDFPFAGGSGAGVSVQPVGFLVLSGDTVLRLEYDPNRSANIALIEYEDGEKRYILAPVGLKAGHK